MENPYKFKSPRDTKERVEALYNEFRCSTVDQVVPQSDKTTKDLIVDVLANLRHLKHADERKREDEKYSLHSALIALGFIAIALLMLSGANTEHGDWLHKNRFAMKLWGIAFAAVFIGISIERTSLFQTIWAFGFAKFFASIAVSALLIYTAGKASTLINATFGVDASVFPLTRAYVIGFLSFQLTWPILSFVAGIFALIHAFDGIGYLASKFNKDYNYSLPPWHSYLFLVLFLFVLGISWKWTQSDFSDAVMPVKIYRLAHKLDFNSKHPCINLREKVNVVFVGSDHAKVLVDTQSVNTEDIESFIDRAKSNDLVLPKAFFFMTCQTGIREK